MSEWRVVWTAWKGTAHRKLTGHNGDVSSVAIGQVADRDVIVSAGGWTVCIWDPATGKLIGEPIGTAAGEISAMVLGRAGGRDVIACACGRRGFQEVRIWDAVTRDQIGPPLPGRATSVAAMVLGQARGRDVIACADRGDHTVRIWDAVTGQPIGRPTAIPSGWHYTLASARAGRRDVIVVGVGEPSVYSREGSRPGHATTALLDPKNGKLIGRPRQINNDGVASTIAVTYEPARDLVLYAGQMNDQKIRIWDARTGRAIGQPLDAPGAPLAFGWIADRLILVSAYGSEAMRFWDVFTGEQVRYPLTSDYSPSVLALGRVGDRDVIVCGCRDHVELMDWDAEDHPFGHTDSVLCLASGIVGDREIILSAAACDDDAVRVWDAATGHPFGPSLTPHHVSIDALASGRAGDRDVVITADQNSSRTAGQIRVWDPSSGVQIGDPIPCGRDVAALAMGRIGDRDLIVSAASDGVATWDAVTREAVSRLPFIKPDRPRALALALDPIGPGTEILCAAVLAAEVIMYAWDAATGDLMSAVGIGVVVSRSTLALARLMGRPCIVFVDQRDQDIHIRDAFDGHVVGPAFTHPPAEIHALAAGRAAGRDVVVTGGSDGTVTVWDAVTGEPFGEPLTAHEGPVRAVALAHVNGTDYIISGGNDRRVICWTASPPA